VLIVSLAEAIACSRGDKSHPVKGSATTPTRQPAPAVASGIAEWSHGPHNYRLHLTTEDDLSSREADVTITENEDHTFRIQEQRPGGARSAVTEDGAWHETAGGAVAVDLTNVNGRKPRATEELTIEMRDGFPVVTGYSGKTLYDIRAAAFDLGTGDRHPLVRELHRRLARVRYLHFDDPGSDLFAEETRKAVVAFQEAEGLYPDGEVDVETWMQLAHPPPPLPTETPLPPEPAERRQKITPGTTHLEVPRRTEDGRPIIYFTFDDGPSKPYSQQILDLLARNRARGTFFVVGRQMRAYPGLVRAEAAAGHFVGNHSMHHKNLSRLEAHEFLAEVATTRDLILETLGDVLVLDKGMHYLRPPYGALSPNALQYAARHGFTIALWDIDPMDWRRPPADVMTRDILRSAFPGAIVLLHDGGGDRSHTIAALEVVLRELKARGYVFRSIGTPPSTSRRFR